MTKTNAYSILCVLVRVFALWLFVNAVIGLPEAFETAKRFAPFDHAAQVAYGGCAFVFAVASFLWVFADRVAKLALARPQQVVFESDVSVSEWQALAFSVVGLWQAIDGIAFLSTRAARLASVHLADSSGAAIGLPDDFYGWVAADCLRLAIGIALLFGSRGLVGLIRRYRQVGHAPALTIQAGQSGDVDGANPGAPPPP